jgi:hypothetical protein
VGGGVHSHWATPSVYKLERIDKNLCVLLLLLEYFSDRPIPPLTTVSMSVQLHPSPFTIVVVLINTIAFFPLALTQNTHKHTQKGAEIHLQSRDAVF